MTTYLGSSPYCYASSLAMTVPGAPAPPVIEALTGSAFGYQQVGPLPLFDPAGWDPDLGVDQALRILGAGGRRETFESGSEALARLEELAERGPVFVGPLEMGLLLHQPGSGRPFGADHFVVVVAVDDEAVTMHDPQGYPYARLPAEDFAAAWGAETLGYGMGRFPLRTGFTAPQGGQDAWATRLLPLAGAWARGARAGGMSGNVAGLRALAAEAEAGLEEPAATLLQDFSLRLGARRRADAADLLLRYPAVSEALETQARVLGGAQLAAVRGDGVQLASALRQVAELHEDLLALLP